MVSLLAIQNGLWFVCQAVICLLIILLYRRENYRAYPYFTAYLLLTVGQTLVLLFAYHFEGFGGMRSFQIAWLSQGMILIARGLAVAELCRRILAAYRGIWGLALRLLGFFALTVTLYSSYVADWRWQVAVYAADRGVELSIATVIVVLLAFSRYYQVPIAAVDRSIAAGFCLYSCFIVLNNTILEAFFEKYVASWNVLSSFAYLASLAIWTRAIWSAAPARSELPELVEAGVYRRLSPEINARLRMLNEQLLSFWQKEVPHS